jgi:hypothetical protein
MPLIVKVPVESISNAVAELLDEFQPNIAIDPNSTLAQISNPRAEGICVEVVRNEHSNIITLTSEVINENTLAIVKQGVEVDVQLVLESLPGVE